MRVVYSPLDCLKLARANPSKRVVFFAIGFETTAPANAMSVWQARAQGIENYSMLVSHVTVPPAMTAILESPNNRVQAFLGAGHVCAVMGWEEYEPLAARYRVPIVVTGFEPLDLLEGIFLAVRQLEEGRHEVENAYSRAVSREGNREARRMIFAGVRTAATGPGAASASSREAATACGRSSRPMTRRASSTWRESSRASRRTASAD